MDLDIAGDDVVDEGVKVKIIESGKSSFYSGSCPQSNPPRRKAVCVTIIFK